MALSSDPSAVRNFRRTIVPARAVGRPRKHPELKMFYGFPAAASVDRQLSLGAAIAGAKASMEEL
jgi:hypothetical protein